MVRLGIITPGMVKDPKIWDYPQPSPSVFFFSGGCSSETRCQRARDDDESLCLRYSPAPQEIEVLDDLFIFFWNNCEDDQIPS